ncbi:redoxin domain-containing protein [Dokdonella sp.]|uniref:redoxin domain-containing protein n=1 Tax=Dokdonella sp. TaxID=2291710 RepID=UPI003C469849
MNSNNPLAPEIEASDWLNTDRPLSLAGLRGRVVVLHAFQMLCPGCVSHGLPQARRIREVFSEEDVAVIGLHTVFEHHDVMGADALRVFVHEYRIGFPVGIDKAAGNGGIPLTMQNYALRGTPSLLLIDRRGHLRLNHFGRIDDLQMGALIGQWVNDSADSTSASTFTADDVAPGRCSVERNS